MIIFIVILLYVIYFISSHTHYLISVFGVVLQLSRLILESACQIVFLFFFFVLCCFVLAALGLCCCVRAFSSCGEQGLLFVAVHGLLIAVASLVVEHRL